ncbi:sensor histidine kinase [Paenibacillus jiagnxiensis]|uniref:sensor histidine kinase n=1 Tax=Paenibacillus jiagnxiensis TaxID=3228926 RepID=UPI0033BC2B7B
MFNRLYIRLAVIIVGMAAGILVIFAVISMFATHYHISMYMEQVSLASKKVSPLMDHLESALIQSILLTGLFSLLLALIIGVYFAKRISRPLVRMKQAAERISRGSLDVRISTEGRDEIAELGASLNRLSEQLQRQQLLRMSMSQDIAHELRTPLTTLKSHMRALEDGVWEPTPARIHSCLEEVERLIQLVSELEELNVMDSPEFQLLRKEENLRLIVGKAAAVMEAAFLEKGVQLQYEGISDVILLMDADRMKQILVNLLTNALHHTPAGGTVSVRERKEKGAVCLVISDTGPGISVEDLPYIFERFYRGDKSRNRQTGGSGMGLAIVRKLVEAHGGEVWAQSDSSGARFYIRLPM